MTVSRRPHTVKRDIRKQTSPTHKVTEFVNVPGIHSSTTYALSPILSLARFNNFPCPALDPTIMTTPSSFTRSRTSAAVRRMMGSVWSKSMMDRPDRVPYVYGRYAGWRADEACPRAAPEARRVERDRRSGEGAFGAVADGGRKRGSLEPSQSAPRTVRQSMPVLTLDIPTASPFPHFLHVPLPRIFRAFSYLCSSSWCCGPSCGALGRITFGERSGRSRKGSTSRDRYS